MHIYEGRWGTPTRIVTDDPVAALKLLREFLVNARGPKGTFTVRVYGKEEDIASWNWFLLAECVHDVDNDTWDGVNANTAMEYVYVHMKSSLFKHVDNGVFIEAYGRWWDGKGEDNGFETSWIIALCPSGVDPLVHEVAQRLIQDKLLEGEDPDTQSVYQTAGKLLQLTVNWHA
jgi:hypothetical protein